ncbi:MAG: DUF1365 domain-containing protein [Candidatus Eiseniibacteriota bacterium]|jgi:DUF1365 family protein
MSPSSCIYTGTVRHRRHAPVRNAFTYGLYMMYLDLGELPTLFDRFPGWSARRPAPAWFRRADHLGDPSVPLDTAVRDLVEHRLGRRPEGPIRLLTHLRYLGYCFNPLSVYYCYDREARHVETLVAEVTNTPWGERHHYVLDDSANLGTAGTKRFRLGKRFFVSPFMDMDVDYDWRFVMPGRQLVIHMDNAKPDGSFFDATMVLERRALTAANLARVLVRHPLMTLEVIAAIHWQALKLVAKRCPTCVHPRPPADDTTVVSQRRNAGTTLGVMSR